MFRHETRLPCRFARRLRVAYPSTPSSARQRSGAADRDARSRAERARHAFRVAGPMTAVRKVVFLHGVGSGSAHFEALAGPFMERRLRIVYLDQRAVVTPTASSGDYALATLVEDVELCDRTLGVPKIALLGHSFGGLWHSSTPRSIRRM